MRWLPQRLGSRVAAVVLLGVVAAHGAALFITWQRTDVLNPVSQSQVVERMVIAYRLAVNTAAGDEFQTLLWAVGSPEARFWIEDVDSRPLRPMNEPELRIAQRLATYLPDVPFDDISVRLDDVRGADPARAARMHRGWSVADLSIALPLPNGQWLYSYQQPLAGYQWLQLVGFSLPVSMLPIVAIVLIVIHWTVRPIRRLAQAAEKVSRGERVDVLDASGPQETRELAVAFNTMQQALMAYVEDRTRMLAAISHDIRTPITSLRLRAEMLPEGKTREAMIRTLADMQGMVEQTLRFARDDAVSEATQQLDLAQLLADLVADRTAGGASVRAALAASAPYRGRPIALRRAFGNVIDNALKFGRQVEVRLAPAGAQAAGAAGRSWVVEVDDDGPGLPGGLLEKVFEPFFQVDESRHHAPGGGVGLGLSIARSCIRAHGGTLVLTHRPGGGLRAVIELPVA